MGLQPGTEGDAAALTGAGERRAGAELAGLVENLGGEPRQEPRADLEVASSAGKVKEKVGIVGGSSSVGGEDLADSEMAFPAGFGLGGGGVLGGGVEGGVDVDSGGSGVGDDAGVAAAPLHNIRPAGLAGEAEGVLLRLWCMGFRREEHKEVLSEVMGCTQAWEGRGRTNGKVPPGFGALGAEGEDEVGDGRGSGGALAVHGEGDPGSRRMRCNEITFPLSSTALGCSFVTLLSFRACASPPPPGFTLGRVDQVLGGGSSGEGRLPAATHLAARRHGV